MKGVIVAGGTGSRLRPVTLAVGKQLLPVYDKPMIYYPLSVLMMAGIREICLVTSAGERDRLAALLGDGAWLGCRFVYREQAGPDGIADAMAQAADFVDGAPFALILGDNIFHGVGLVEELTTLRQRFCANERPGARIFTFPVREPERYGVLHRNRTGTPVDIVEKPQDRRSKEAIVGLYFYDGRAMAYARSLAPSARGELEISDINRRYLANGELAAKHLGRGYVWFDAGTPDALMQASSFVHALEERQGLKMSCPEEVAYRKGFISTDDLQSLADSMGNSPYGAYLAQIAAET